MSIILVKLSSEMNWEHCTINWNKVSLNLLLGSPKNDCPDFRVLTEALSSNVLPLEMENLLYLSWGVSACMTSARSLKKSILSMKVVRVAQPYFTSN
jgi:hypothetical protein